MFHEIDLKALSEHHGPERAFLSVYLSNERAWDSLSNRVTGIRDMLSDEPAELEHFEENLKRVEEFLEQHKWKEPALCIFTSWAADFFKAYALEAEIPDRVWAGASLYIRPLAELQDEYENFAVVAADNSEAHIYLVTSAQPTQEDRVKGGIKNHVKKGGWSQKRYQRRRDNELMHYSKEIVEALEDLARSRSFNRLILAGSEETLQAIQEELTPELKEMLVEAQAVDLDATEAMWEEVFELFEQQERADERALWQRIKDEYMSNGHAVFGFKDVTEAATLGRVEAMIVTRDVKQTGTRCRECDNLSADEVSRCPFCKSKDIFAVDLVNDLVQLMEQTSAVVDFSDPIEGLTKAGDVAALLRY